MLEVQREKEARGLIFMPSHDKLSATAFDALNKEIIKQAPEGDRRRSALARIERLDPNKPLEREDEMASVWAALEQSSPAADAFETIVAEQWRKAGCDAEGAPYVVRGLLRRLESGPFEEESPHIPKLAVAFLDEEHRAGARGLTEGETSRLKAIAGRAPTSERNTQTPKQ